MAGHRYVNTALWSDAWVLEELDPSEKLLFVYLLTNQETNIAGVYKMSLKRIAFETGLDTDTVRRIIGRFQAAGKVMYVEGWVILVNARKHQEAVNPSVQKGIDRILAELPERVREAVLTGCTQDGPREVVEYSRVPHSSPNSPEEQKACLVGSIMESYKSQHPRLNELRELHHIRSLAEIAARERDPTSWCTRFLETARRMHADPKSFLKDQPFTPHIHMGKTFDHIVAKMDARDETDDLEVMV